MSDIVPTLPSETEDASQGRRASRAAAAERRKRRSRAKAAAITACVAVVVGGLLAWFGVIQGENRGRIASGTTVSGLDLGGLRPAAAEARLLKWVERRGLQSVTLRTADGVMDVPLSSIGITYDVPATVAAAMRVGRASVLGLDVYTGGGGPLEPVIRVKARTYVQGLVVVRDEVDQPPVDASLRLDGRRVFVVPAVDGIAVDDIRLERSLLSALARGERFDGVVPTRSVPAETTTADAEERRAAAAGYLKRALVLRLHGRRVRLRPVVLATILTVNRGADAADYPLTFDNRAARRLLKRMFAREQRAAVDARVVVRGGKIYIKESRQGVAIDMQELVDDMTRTASAGGFGTVSVSTRPVYPSVSSNELRSMGLSALGSEFTTYYAPENKARAGNIALAAKLVDGTIIRPGDTFSLNQTLGPRTQNRGFDSAPVIVDGVLRQGVGGGVCQYATTLFNAVFFAGLPIIERHTHTFAIEHYPVGRDAAVAWGSADLRFKNTTDHPLMITSFTRKGSLTVVIVGSTGREVTYTTGRMRAFRSPAATRAHPRVISDADLSRGIVKWEKGSRGYTVTVVRTVRSNGKVLFRDRFVSTYAPRDWVKRVGTRT